MVLLNRRGYAPVLHCVDCGWKSDCPHCSAHQVFPQDRPHPALPPLRLHRARAPPLPHLRQPRHPPHGPGHRAARRTTGRPAAQRAAPRWQPARIARIDADTTKAKGALEAQLAQVHAGEVDVLVGTQMIAKGHDFRRITLVAAVQPDGALFSSDFRAPERLFALLMQAAGRAGRDAAYMAAQGTQCEMWVQSFHPQHAVFEALRTHDYPAFAAQQLKEREEAAMPPFSYQALVRADARTQEAAQAFLNLASQAVGTLAQAAAAHHATRLWPMGIQRVANIERSQMLIESASRLALQRFLSVWQALLHSSRSLPECRGLLRWAIDVDPLLI
jgi:primosomal protein N' (replication factor Y)